MKINFKNNLNYLAEGSHEVEITEVIEGESKNLIPYFRCKFKNDSGIIYQKFYLTQNSLPFIKKLFEAVGIDQPESDTNDLVGKCLNITVETKDWINPSTGEIIAKNRDVVWFEKILLPF